MAADDDRRLRSRAVEDRLRQRFDDGIVLAAALAGLALLALALRIPGALALPFWQDEVASARVIAQPTLSDLLGQVRATESTPPLWYALAWAGHEAGISLEGLRMLSVSFSALTAVLVVLYARRFLPFLGAVLAGVLVAVGFQFVAHGRELRSYALYVLLCVLFALVLSAAARAPSLGRLAALAGVAAAGLLTHYLFAFTLLSGVIWLWLGSQPRRTRIRATLAAAAGLVPLLASWPILAEQVSAERFGWISDFGLAKVAYVYGTIFDWGGPLYADDPTVFGVRQAVWLAALPVVLGGAVVLWRRSDEGRLCALLAVGPVAITAVVWLAGPDIFNTRNVLGVGPFAAMAVVAALGAIPRPVAIAGSAAALALVGIGAAQGPPFGPPADRVANALLAQGWKSGDRIVLFGDYFGFRSPVGWYLPGRPSLHLTGAAHPDDADVFLIAQGTRTWEALRWYYAVDFLTLSRIGDVFVARLPNDESLARELQAIGGYVLAPPDEPEA
jgi:hypothetical protein